MRAKKIAEGCGLRFHVDLHKQFVDLSQRALPDYWFVEYCSADKTTRLFAPTPARLPRFQFVVELNTKDIDESVKLVNTICEMERVKCYDHVGHTAEVLSGSLGDFAFASTGEPIKLLNGFYECNATIDPAKMANPNYDTFWKFDRARYCVGGKFGVVKYNERNYVPFVGIDKVFLVNLKKFYELRDYYLGELQSHGLSFHLVRGIANFRMYE